MENTVDARGLLCPEPVLLVKKEMSRIGAKGRIHVLVDSGAARENVTRLAKGQGWQVKTSLEGDTTLLILTKAG
ncbi:MAG: sulfurtransferase TusA family protein [Bacillota bacterium]